MLASYEVILRLLMAALCGGAVGLERERLEWVAGLRTHMLVCLGSALVMIVSTYGFHDVINTPNIVLDPSRMAAQVVSGIGFLGAGTILFLRKQVIRGLTTAASLWTAAAVGLAVGGGLYLAAASATVLILVILALVKPLKRRLFRHQKLHRFNINVANPAISLQSIEAALNTSGFQVKSFRCKKAHQESEYMIEIVVTNGDAPAEMSLAADRLKALSGVNEVSIF